jgi:hypothetical protein
VKIGDFVKGSLDGYGEYSLPEIQYLYRGIFKNGYPHNVGQEFSPGVKFRGQFNRGAKHGIGIYEELDSQTGQYITYSGNWVQNEKHNYGL